MSLHDAALQAATALRALHEVVTATTQGRKATPRGATAATPTMADALRRNAPEMTDLLEELRRRLGKG